ncbi:MAG: pyridoxamine 5'-phosphate oxidase family protein [Parasphingopyxis sp.]|uniref:pyridoxamine 5'-phosphate oxidase family protein n=1 Tax=Parasphingopyxis sp. TaxID=1920299 RepID=UPI003F9EBF29
MPHETETAYPMTARTRVRRKADRASYERDAIHAILDEALTCSVAIVKDGYPHCQPMIHLRDGERIILHGAAGNALLGHLADGAECCISVAMVDGLHLGQTISDHSFDYRSATIYGSGAELHEPAEKLACLEQVFGRIVPDRWREMDPVDPGYLAHVRVIAIPLRECVAKINAGPVDADDPEKAATVWAGRVPLRLSIGEPQAAAGCTAPLPDYIRRYPERRR